MDAMPELGDFGNLDAFSCSHNRLTELPAMDSFLDLEEFEASKNMLTGIPESLRSNSSMGEGIF
jgi:Leucine-rich repeat (LRR) protein